MRGLGWPRAACITSMRLLLRAFVLLETALVLAGAAGANGGGDAAPSPPSMRLSISKRCNESIMASNYNAGFQV